MRKRGIASGNFRTESGRAWRGCQIVIDSIKAGKATHEKGSLADAARNRMIERENGNKDKPKTAKDARKAMIERDAEGHPDKGGDRGKRKAYPAE